MENSRKILLSFSSEEPYSRWWGVEILDHSESAVDLSRLNDIGCLLFNHKSDNVIGKVINAWTENNRGQAEVEFDDDELSELVYKKVSSGTLKGVSVGYRVNSWEEVMPGKKSSDGRFTGPCEIARSWEPLEISVVSVPADATVGVGRDINFEEEYQEEKGMDEEKVVETRSANESAEIIVPVIPPLAGKENEIREKAVEAERQRVTEISTLCREFNVDADIYIKDGKSINDVKDEVLKKLMETHKPVSASVTTDEKDKFVKAAADGLLLRENINIDKPAEGSNQFRSLSLRDIAIECLEHEGINGARRMDNNTLFRQFFSPTSLFPSILDNTINKAYEEGYKTIPTTFELWTSKGSLKDFKETKSGYLAGPAADFLLVPEGSELKHDVPKDIKTPTRSLKTYGRQFTMTREAFINDDIEYLVSIPSRYAQAARRTINKQVYNILIQNPVIYDGIALFSDEHKNLIGTGSEVSGTSIQRMITKMQLQKDQFGESISLTPSVMIVPVGYGFKIKTIFASPTINTPENTQAINPLYNYQISVVEEALLNALIKPTDPMPWFMVTRPALAKAIQVDYLNGQETPIIRRMEAPGQLGFIWDIWLDWGVNVMDYRGIIRNNGVEMPEI